MTKKDDSLNLIKLEDDPIWKEACDIAEYIYSVIDDLPDEEKYTTKFKLRSAANDLIFFAAQACSGAMPSVKQNDWGYVRRTLGGLKTMYRFASVRQKFINLEPEIMIRITKLSKEVDKRLEEAHRETKEYEEKETGQWRERYQLWKEASEFKDKATNEK